MADLYQTGNTVPSKNMKDLSDNAQVFDEFINSDGDEITGRLGDKITPIKKRTQNAIDSMDARFSAFLSSAGYVVIGDYEDGPYMLTEFVQLIRYGGEFYRLAASTGTPYMTAGVTEDSWSSSDAANFVSVGDATLRANLGSSEGPKYIGSGLTTLDKILRVNALQFGAHSTTEPGYESFDSTSSVQKAMNYVSIHGGGVVFLPEGHFICASYNQVFNLPGDDGTASPAFIATGADQNITPEATSTMHAALKIPHNVILRGSMRGLTVIDGQWNVNADEIGLSSGVGIYVSRDNVGTGGTVTYGLEDITLTSYFIGRVVAGISFASCERNLKITSCGISGVFQGMDQHTWSGQCETTGCISGDVIGGWWLQRNNTQNINNIPPYAATDVYLLGWADSCPTETLTAGQLNGSWGARHNAIDAFFDTYFFKSANSATTASGGRLTNTSDNTGAIPSWRGIAGRARTILSRYGRPVNRMDIDNIKLIRQHRTPVYFSDGFGESVISHAYFEGVGLVDNTGTAIPGNLFGIDVADPLNTGEAGIGYMLARGGIGVKNFTVSSKNQHAQLCDTADRKNAFYRGTLYVPSLTDSLELERASVWDGVTTDIRYMRKMDSAFSQPIAFSLGGATFKYSEGYFTPTLTINGIAITGLAVSRGHYKRIGNTITGGVQFSSAGAMSLSSGHVVIGGLPFTIPSGPLAYHHGMVDTYSHAAAGVNVRPFFNDGTATITLATDSRGTEFTGSNTPGSAQLFLRVSFTMIISG
ncbi:hypothetical protein VSX61_19725 [Brenneria populi subsp. brevivirga]|uniref:hypothetical protein n=1 Tax=Brenneria populi TaxID=1505588 RepID=UPI002E1769EB|nr:hypothetical protein [Brenneria populi subsp. brevivirga]